MRIIGLLIPLSLAAPVAFAGGAYGAREVVQHIFDVADTDQNGSLTRAEYEDAGLQKFGVSFDECDIDESGETSMA